MSIIKDYSRTLRRAGIRLLVCLLILATVLVTFASADIPYATYNYLNDGTRIPTQHAYVPGNIVDLHALGVGEVSGPADVYVDSAQNVYISDSGNNRILCLDSAFKLQRVIESYTIDGKSQKLSDPNGLWVTDDGLVYVADTGNGLVVAIDKKDQAVRMMGKPDSELLEKDLIYRPTSVAVDPHSRVYIIASGVTMGLIVFNGRDEFQGFSGAQKVTYNVVDYLWKQFMSEEQKSRMTSFVPTEYSDLTIDSRGFIYAVSAGYEAEDVDAMITSRQTDGRVSPIRKLNFSGYDILKRDGFYPPAGDIEYEESDDGTPQVSALIDVDLGEADTYSVLDRQRGRIFTYSQKGDLLFAFGNKDSRLGNSLTPAALAYKGSDLLVLDSSNGRLTVYERTEYGDLLISAQEKYNSFRFDEAIADWERILELNPNFSLAYDGIGDSLLQKGEYVQAMEYFTHSDNMKQYSEAFQQYRNQMIRRFLLPILAGVILLAVGLVFLFRLIGRKNLAYASGSSKGLGNELLYAFYIMRHPFDGFWDLKHEKRGSARAAWILLALLFLVDALQRIMTARIFNEQYSEPINLVQIFLNSAGIALIFILANWCLTSLMNGEGRMKDIFICTAYALVPMILFKAAAIPLSYVLTINESYFLSIVNALAYIWGIGQVPIGK